MAKQEPIPWSPDAPFARFAERNLHDFDYFQLLYLIERYAPDAAPIGEQGPVARERVRLRPALNLGFPAGDLAEIAWRDDPLGGDGHLLITTTFLGLYGSDSPLPTHTTEMLLSEQDDDVRVREFIDIFHHRLFSLLYRCWKKYRYYISFRDDGSDPLSTVVRGLLGIATPHLAEQLDISPLRLFRYAGLLTQRPRSASGLRGQLRDYFQGVEFDLEQCVGRWLWIQENDQNRMGLGKCSLGKDFLLGEKLFDRSGKFRVQVGPVGFRDYARFLPEGAPAQRMRELVQFYCDDPLEFDYAVTLRGEEVPETPLGSDPLLGKLSWTTFLKSEPSEDKTVIFSIEKRPTGGNSDPDHAA